MFYGQLSKAAGLLEKGDEKSVEEAKTIVAKHRKRMGGDEQGEEKAFLFVLVLMGLICFISIRSVRQRTNERTTKKKPKTDPKLKNKAWINVYV